MRGVKKTSVSTILILTRKQRYSVRNEVVIKYCHTLGRNTKSTFIIDAYLKKSI